MPIRIKIKFLLPILLLSGTGILNAGWVVKGGWNRSIPQNKDGESIGGITVGAGYEWRLAKKIPLYLTCDLLYSTWGATYRNKTWSTNNHDKDVIVGDRFINIGFWEIPVQLKYSIKITNKLTSFISTGIVRTSEISDFSGVKYLYYIYLKPEEKKNYQFDYERYDEGSLSVDRAANRGFDSCFNAGLNFQRFGIELFYIHALHEIKSVGALSLNEKINTIHIILRFNF